MSRLPEDPSFELIANHCAVSRLSTVSRDAWLGHAVTIYPKCTIGSRTALMDGAVIGRPPLPTPTLSLAVSVGYRDLKIGADCRIGAHAVIYTGCEIGSSVLVGDLASMREDCKVADGSVVGRGVMMLAGVSVGARSRIQDQVHLAGDTVVEADVFIGMGVVTTNDNDIYLSRFGLVEPRIRGVIIRRFSVAGAGATILPGVEIGQGAMVAAGSVVTRDVPPWTIVAGSPAKKLKDVPSEWRRCVEQRFSEEKQV